MSEQRRESKGFAVFKWLATLAVFAIAIGVFLVIALPSWLSDAPWEDLEDVRSISLGAWGACVIHTDGSVACRGSLAEDPPGTEFLSVSVGRHHACGVKADRSVACWTSGGRPWGEPPGNRFASVSSGSDYACVVTSEGPLLCWGLPGFLHGVVPDGNFIAVSVGQYHSCGIRVDGSVACWGVEVSVLQSTPNAALLVDGDIA